MNGRETSAVAGTATVEWQERKPPVKFDFGAGVELIGVLVSADRGSVRDKRTGISKAVTRYVVEQLAPGGEILGETVFFHGTVQLDTMLRPSDVGHYVNIVCTGEDKEAGRAGNAMKLFRVNVTKQTAPGWASDGSEITDADIPAGF